MAATDIGARNVPPVAADDLDDLFDYDVGDVFHDVNTNMDVPTMQRSIEKADGKENGAGLGIDKEIKITKKRAPVPKLDENRLGSKGFRSGIATLISTQAPITSGHSQTTPNYKRASEIQRQRPRGTNARTYLEQWLMIFLVVL